MGKSIYLAEMFHSEMGITPISIHVKKVYLITLFKCQEPPNKKGFCMGKKIHFKDQHCLKWPDNNTRVAVMGF